MNANGFNWYKKDLQPQFAIYPFKYFESQYQMDISQQFIHGSFYSYL